MLQGACSSFDVDNGNSRLIVGSSAPAVILQSTALVLQGEFFSGCGKHVSYALYQVRDEHQMLKAHHPKHHRRPRYLQTLLLLFVAAYLGVQEPTPLPRATPRTSAVACPRMR